MIQFSVGYGGHDGFEDLIAEYTDRVAEVYCAPPFTESSAGVRHISYEHPYALKLHVFLDFAREQGIRTNLLFDQLCLGPGYASETRSRDMLRLVRSYVRRYGVAAVTVSSIADGERIKQALPDLAVHVSETMFVAYPEHARQVAHFADVITLDRDLNRDLDAIGAVKDAAGKPVQIVANMACVYRCMLRVHVLNASSHYVDWGVRGGQECIARFARDPALLLKSTLIRPEDLGRYDDLVDLVKLDSLFWDTDRLARLLDAYTSGAYSGNLWEIAGGGAGTFFGDASVRGAAPVLSNDDIPEGFFEKVTRCSRICSECGYCSDLAPAPEEDPVDRAVRTALQ